jgi:DnaJ-class molecular chaperone
MNNREQLEKAIDMSNAAIAKVEGETMECTTCGGEGGWSAGDPTNPRAMTPCSVCEGSGVKP